jgi:three-Cys-motif partner protein
MNDNANSELTPGPHYFDWTDWRTTLPPLEDHSEAKLNVLRSYIEDYIQILCTGNPGQERFRLALVDGFAGGGMYRDEKIGSPFVLLNAVKVAEARINQTRTKKISVDCIFYFVESNACAAESLEYHLRHSGYAPDLGNKIVLIRSTFQEAQERIVRECNLRFSRGGTRIIFFLDQCGYSDAPPPLLRSISEKLNWKAEFIINFAVDWLTAYVSNESTFKRIFANLKIEHVLPVEKVLIAVSDRRFDPQYVVEALIGPAFQEVSGSRFFSPFYIQASKSNRGYWLVHLAPRRRARSAMLDVYWRVANGCRHFGHTGLDMLTYKSNADPTGYLEGLAFGESTRASVLKHLISDFAIEIRDHHSTGISYREFQNTYCNRTMASEEIIREALVQLMQLGEIEVRGQKGGSKRVDAIAADDVILPGHSPVLIKVERSRKQR